VRETDIFDVDEIAANPELYPVAHPKGRLGRRRQEISRQIVYDSALLDGSVAEWFKAPVLKTGEGSRPP